MKSAKLNEKEKSLLSQIIADEESGTYLLRSRTKAYFELRKELIRASEAMEKGNPNERQKYIFEFAKQCKDYNYYMSLPVELRLF